MGDMFFSNAKAHSSAASFLQAVKVMLQLLFDIKQKLVAGFVEEQSLQP